LYNQAKLEDVILDYKNIAQTIDKKTLLPHQNPNYIYTASGREIKYSESSKDLHGSLTSESILLTIDGKVAYQYEKHGPSTPQKLLNQELLNEIQSELNVLMNQSRVKDTDNQEPQKSISEATEISKKVAPSTVVLEKLVNQILEDPLVWQKTWSKLSSNGIPVNPLTGNEYSGINLVNLAILQSKLDTTDNRWCSYKQAAEKEYAVSRGEKSYANVLFFIVKHEFTINDIKLNISGTTTKDTLIELNKELNKQYPQLSNSINSVFRNSENKSIFAVVNELNNGPLSASQLKHRVQTVERYTPVFNFSQMRNTPELEVQKKPEDWQSCIKADFILKAMADATGLNVKNDSANSCFYRQDTNSIHMASPQAFSSPNNYYSALLHEVSHARMRETNAVEDFKLSFNPDLYATSIQERAKEELRAELSAVFTCAKIGLNYDLENHSAYLQSWLKAFKNNPEELLTAANEANKISNAIMDRTHEYLKKNNIDIHEFNEPKYRELDLCAISINKNIEPVVINELTNLNKNESTQSVQTQVENSQEICKDISNNENKEFNDKKINSQEGVEKKNEESTIDDAIEVDNNENITQSRRTRR
jgi:antirestriction protein ArdC